MTRLKILILEKYLIQKMKMTEMTSVGDDFDNTIRTIRLKASINKAFEENKELLEKLGSDYDESGTPYWEKND